MQGEAERLWGHWGQDVPTCVQLFVAMGLSSPSQWSTTASAFSSRTRGVWRGLKNHKPWECCAREAQTDPCSESGVGFKKPARESCSWLCFPEPLHPLPAHLSKLLSSAFSLFAGVVPRMAAISLGGFIFLGTYEKTRQLLL